MRLIATAAVTLVALGTPPLPMAAQPASGPAIHSVTLQPDTGVIGITGTGLGPDLTVVVDGQPAAVLPGATATQIEVMAPSTVVTTPGTFRLIVVDPVRRVGDAFVVASQAGRVTGTGASLGQMSTNGSPTPAAAPPVESATSATSPAAATVVRHASGLSPNTVIEDPGAPFRTAIGTFALDSNTTGGYNTAAGFQALTSNTSGGYNSAFGVNALAVNTTGNYNTAVGMQALISNNGDFNTASGVNALGSNTSGGSNTATGYQSLRLNTTGDNNTAVGYEALFSNTTGGLNAAVGLQALRSNTIASANTATGVNALYSNVSGNSNTATGYIAMLSNTIGSGNTAVGEGALQRNTTGEFNTVAGFRALANADGSFNVAVGDNAGHFAGSGSYNVYLGGRVLGAVGDTNTMRLGLPYDAVTLAGQNRTFVAGIYGTQLTAPAQVVFVDANGQLGTLTPPPNTGIGVVTPGAAPPIDPALLSQRLEEQQRLITDLQARLAVLEAERARRPPRR